jgi:hypothetical protein
MPHPLVDEWIRYHAEKRKETDPLFRACEAVDDLVRDDPEMGWTVTLELIEAAPDEYVLANVAAGPLEDLLRRLPDRFIDRMELQARRDPKFVDA